MYAEVIIAINAKEVDRTFDYIVPEEYVDKIKPGMRVFAPFGKNSKLIEGYVVRLKEESGFDAEKIKAISGLKDDFIVFSPVMMELARFMQRKYYTTLSSCLQCIMPPCISLTELKLNYASINYACDGIADTLDELKIKGGKQAEVIHFLETVNGASVAAIKRTLGISQSPLKTLAKKGVIQFQPIVIPRNPFDSGKYEKFEPHVLLPEQAAVFDSIKKRLDDGYNGLKTILLHGITGSGKTEIYMRLIDLVIKRGKQAIMLVPEISLTPQTVKNFVGRFSTKVSVTHSRLSDGERFDQWKRAKDGNISVMIGPRSAIFTPFNNLGIIIIDEEHESTYKSESTPKYDAKEIAAELSRLTGCLVLLGSATPSIDMYHRAQNKKIDIEVLKNRINAKKLPSAKVVDMRSELLKGNRSVFSRELSEAIAENLAKKELTILFLNRRGHSTFVSCRECGHVMCCDKCSINYTYHIVSNRLCCHYCGDEIITPDRCPQCKSEFIKYFGTGTQKIESELLKKFPAARVLRMDLDTTAKKHSHENIYQSFLKGEADILIGTQMIAKGLDFPRVTLVGIIAADITIHVGDFRSAERAYQLITQVSGRSGRAELDGRVIIQTYNPEHYSIKYSCQNDYRAFYEHEIEIRRIMKYPPFTHLFSVMFLGESEKAVAARIYALYTLMQKNNTDESFELLSPTPARIFKIKNVYRHKLIIKGTDEESLKKFVLVCIDELKQKADMSGITVNYTLDPQNIP